LPYLGRERAGALRPLWKKRTRDLSSPTMPKEGEGGRKKEEGRRSDLPLEGEREGNPGRRLQEKEGRAFHVEEKVVNVVGGKGETSHALERERKSADGHQSGFPGKRRLRRTEGGGGLMLYLEGKGRLLSYPGERGSGALLVLSATGGEKAFLS